MARKTHKSRGWPWAAGLAFGAGYLVALACQYAGHAHRAPVLGTAAAVALSIPFAARTRRVLRGALRGLGVGLATSMGVIFGLMGAPRRVSPDVLSVDSTITVVTTLICCSGAGALFAFLAERRQRRLYGEGS